MQRPVGHSWALHFYEEGAVIVRRPLRCPGAPPRSQRAQLDDMRTKLQIPRSYMPEPWLSHPWTPTL